jgi:hypothetical protein
LILKKEKTKQQQMDISMIVLVGFGVIDILFKQIALTTTLPFTSSLFVVFAISLVVMILVVIYERVVKK